MRYSLIFKMFYIIAQPYDIMSFREFYFRVFIKEENHMYLTVTRNLYRQSMATFDGIVPDYHIALSDKPTIVRDFLSLLPGIQMTFSFMLIDEKTPLRLCRHRMKAFVASCPGNQFCSPEYRNQHNVYNKIRAKKKENE
jgi:hypothetical protein